MNAIYSKYPWPDRQWKHDKLVNGGARADDGLIYKGRAVPTASSLKEVRRLLAHDLTAAKLA